MKALVYENIFMVTETLQNGKEKRIKKSVYSPRFKDGKHITQQQRIAEGKAALEAEYYYDIEYVKSVPTKILYIK